MTTSLAALIGATAMPDGGPTVEHAVFGTGDAARLASWYARFCEQVLGSPIAGALFYAASVGCIAGVELADGRRLAVKAYQERWKPEVLHLVATAQRNLASNGFPCPMPEMEPTRFDGVTASVERVLDDPGVRVLAPEEMGASAGGLAEAAELLRSTDPIPWVGLHAFQAAPGALYPEPHSPLFDFSLESDERDVGWIDQLAAAGAAARELDDAPPNLFHCDWAARNIRVVDGRLVASYDWDSLNACKESTAVGNAAATWRSTGEPDDPPAPGPAEIDEYLDTYLRCAAESSGGHDGTAAAATSARTWRIAAMGEALWLLAYTARCEHAIHARYPDVRPRRARDTLEEQRTAFLAAIRSD